MLFKKFGSSGAPTIILLHGGGLSWWSFKNVISLLENGTYELKPQIKNIKAKTLIIVGEKEIAAEKKSAQKLHQNISQFESA
jgi:pimeloyl-ACP methyl ester carboxylesterase